MPPNDRVRDVTLVVPARDAQRTIGACLDAAIAVRDRTESRLARIIVVDDGSRDGTRAEAVARGIEVLRTDGRGAGAARNAGIDAAETSLVWFVDADCVASPDALELLLPHLADRSVAGVGGTYGIAPGATLLERLIHEEIMVRHARMGAEVDFLATFNVVYRREALRALRGFDERYLKGQDAELAFRVLEAGHRLRFERESVVRHFHADRLSRYLRVQRQQGYWRVALHLEHRGHSRGDSYSSLFDHAQPFLAAALPVSCALLPLAGGWMAPVGLVLLLVILQCPMALAMARRAGPQMLAFVALGAVRACWRAAGLATGTVDRIAGRGPIARSALVRPAQEARQVRGGPA
jgi:glycosyltransferase involved in cell wall biosynthesis